MPENTMEDRLNQRSYFNSAVASRLPEHHYARLWELSGKISRREYGWTCQLLKQKDDAKLAAHINQLIKKYYDNANSEGRA